MRFYSFQIVIEKEPEDPGYFAYSPTIEEAKSNIREAIEQHLESIHVYPTATSI
jgi:predicted RNase H-like HicB family nuclease